MITLMVTCDPNRPARRTRRHRPRREAARPTTTPWPKPNAEALRAVMAERRITRRHLRDLTGLSLGTIDLLRRGVEASPFVAFALALGLGPELAARVFHQAQPDQRGRRAGGTP